MVDFIDEHQDAYGVEPICQFLPIAPSTYYRAKKLERCPDDRSPRVLRDDELEVDIQKVWYDNHSNYGARKVWRQLNRESIAVARCTVERLMKGLGLQGIHRRRYKRTTISCAAQEKPMDLVKRNFTASRPNQLWVADFTFVATWTGFVYVAFIIDVFSRYIVGWRVLNTMKTELVLDALEQALWARGKPRGVTHHSDHGSQYLSIRYTERLDEAGFKVSVGTVGDSYDNALAETINGLYKAEVIYKYGSWKKREDVERATLEWVDWFNKRRLLSSIGDRPPAEFEDLYYQQHESAHAA
jgi:putative transposase